MKNLLAILAVIMTLAMSIRHMSRLGACPPSSCAPLIDVECKWDVEFPGDICSGSLYPPCIIDYSKFPIACHSPLGHAYEGNYEQEAVSNSLRPEGVCDEIPCGTCVTTYQTRVCGWWFRCTPVYDSHGQLINCIWHAFRAVWYHSRWKASESDIPCCYDVY